MKKLTTRWYFTLKEVAELYGFDDYLDDVPAVGLATFCADIADEEGVMHTPSKWTSIDDTKNKKMWADYLWPEYADASILYVDELVDPWEVFSEDSDDEGPSQEEVWEKLKPMLPRMVRWLKESTERYSVLIDAYEGIQAKLMGKVETVSESEGALHQIGSTSNSGSGNNSVTTVVDGEVSEQGLNGSSTSSSTTASASGSNASTVSAEGLKSHRDSGVKVELHNDTPQNGGDFLADPYVSDARKTTDESIASDSDSTVTTTSGSDSSSSASDTATTTSGHDSRSTETDSTTTVTGSDSSSTLGTSNISNESSASTTVGSDVTTPIERLNEVREKLHNLYADWAAEFAQFVIYAD